MRHLYAPGRLRRENLHPASWARVAWLAHCTLSHAKPFHHVQSRTRPGGKKDRCSCFPLAHRFCPDWRCARSGGGGDGGGGCGGGGNGVCLTFGSLTLAVNDIFVVQGCGLMGHKRAEPRSSSDPCGHFFPNGTLNGSALRSSTLPRHAGSTSFRGLCFYAFLTAACRAVVADLAVMLARRMESYRFRESCRRQSFVAGRARPTPTCSLLASKTKYAACHPRSPGCWSKVFSGTGCKLFSFRTTCIRDKIYNADFVAAA